MINLFFIIFILSVLLYGYLTIHHNTKFLFGIFFIFTIITQLISNIFLTKSICNDDIQWVVSIIALIPWAFLLIFKLIITLLPGWLRPFSNTIGYFVVLMFGIKKLFINILKPTDKNNQALLDIYINPSLLINEITEENFDKFWISSKNIIKPEFYNNNTIKDKLLYMVKLKYIVSETIWYFLFGFLITAITNNYISSVKCNISVETLQKNDIKYHKEMLTKSNNNNNTKRVYTSNE